MMYVITEEMLHKDLASLFRDSWTYNGRWRDARAEILYYGLLALGENPSDEALKTLFHTDNLAGLRNMTCGLCGNHVDKLVRYKDERSFNGQLLVVNQDVCFDCIDSLFLTSIGEKDGIPPITTV